MVMVPTYKIELGSMVLDSQKSNDMTDMTVRLSIDSAPGSFEATVALADKKPNMSKGDVIKVSIGHDNDMTNVFTGKADSLVVDGGKVTVLSPLAKLYELRIDRFYDHQSAGAIVKDLAGEAKVDVDTASDGLKFPSFVVSKSKSAYEQIVELAQICDFDFRGTNEGKLVFKKHQPKSPHNLRYAKNIIDIKLVDQNPPVDSVKVAGSSPSDSKGSDKHHWMTKKNVEGTSGSGEGGRQMLIQNMAIKDKDSAKKIADAVLKKLKSTISVNVHIIGNEKIMLGDMVKIQDVPDKSLNGDFQVREIEHVLSKSEGFTTTLVCRGNPVQ